MMNIGVIHNTIIEFLQSSGARRKDLIILMGPDLLEELKKNHEKISINEKPTHIFGVEIIVKEQIQGKHFGITFQSCKDHIDEHVDELLELFQEEWKVMDIINCDLCQHPINTELAVEGSLICPWCGDKQKGDF